LGPSNFGLINYAASVVAFVVPIMQLGFRSTLVQELVDHPEKEGETLGTALFLNVIASVASIVGVVSFAAIANAGEPVTIIVCALYSLNLVFQAIQMIQYWFQAKLMSKYTSVTALIAYAIISAYRVFLLMTGKSIYWFAVSQALDYMLIAVTLVVIYKKLGGQKLSFSKTRAKEMFSKSRYYIVSAMMVTIFGQTDKIMLKLMVDDAATGFYSAAVTCAGMTSFVFAAIIDSARPTIVKSKNVDQAAFEKNMSFLYAIIIYFALLQSVFITVFSKWIVAILYDTDYAATVGILRLIVWYTTFSYMGAVRDVWILSENQHRYLWVINMTGAIANVVLNAVLIPFWGALGAALASLVTQFFTNVIVGFIMKPIRPNNRLMIKGLDPRLLVGGVRKLLKR
ncbi:MAG: flippase, partial [Clostridia bacterium]|nr:flippase [Clostridia bacterium]